MKTFNTHLLLMLLTIISPLSLHAAAERNPDQSDANSDTESDLEYDNEEQSDSDDDAVSDLDNPNFDQLSYDEKLDLIERIQQENSLPINQYHILHRAIVDGLITDPQDIALFEERLEQLSIIIEEDDYYVRQLINRLNQLHPL